MVTAAEMCFPLETDNIEIATPLTTQATPPHETLTPLSLLDHTSSAALLLQVCRVWCSLPCNGKLLELAALLTVWQVRVLCQLRALTLLWAESGVSLGRTLEK